MVSLADYYNADDPTHEGQIAKAAGLYEDSRLKVKSFEEAVARVEKNLDWARERLAEVKGVMEQHRRMLAVVASTSGEAVRIPSVGDPVLDTHMAWTNLGKDGKA